VNDVPDVPVIVIVPVRLPVISGPTVNWTVPGPVPFPPLGDVTEMKFVLLLTALHVQPAAVVKVMVPMPPVKEKFCDIGEIEYVQPDTCVTVSVCVATVMVPTRCGPLFAMMLKFTVPLPVPELPDVICRNDGALLVAVHGQAAFVIT
jgi:hypothetical protein